jgi:hypothetical protein
MKRSKQNLLIKFLISCKLTSFKLDGFAKVCNSSNNASKAFSGATLACGTPTLGEGDG